MQNKELLTLENSPDRRTRAFIQEAVHILLQKPRVLHQRFNVKIVVFSIIQLFLCPTDDEKHTSKKEQICFNQTFVRINHFAYYIRIRWVVNDVQFTYPLFLKWLGVVTFKHLNICMRKTAYKNRSLVVRTLLFVCTAKLRRAKEWYIALGYNKHIKRR